MNTILQPTFSFTGEPKTVSLQPQQKPIELPPRRTATYQEEPGYYADGKLWLYGNIKLLHGSLGFVEEAFGPPPYLEHQLREVERAAEALVLAGKTLVCGVHNPPHQRAAVVPLRWGSPRIVIFSGGIKHHLGSELNQEPFRIARLWRYEWDAKTDLAISLRAPDKLPTFAHHNPTVDRLIREIANFTRIGFASPLSTMRPRVEVA